MLNLISDQRLERGAADYQRACPEEPTGTSLEGEGHIQSTAILPFLSMFVMCILIDLEFLPYCTTPVILVIIFSHCSDKKCPFFHAACEMILNIFFLQVHSDFAAAATRGAMAVIDGNVMAINPGEETRMQMFIWNNIFFSLGFDVRDHYRELGGDAAAHAAPTNDLNGVRAYGAVDVEGLYTLGTVVVDYRGYRVTAQSIIPGILEREHEQSVIYGSIDFGKTVVSHNKYMELLDKTSRPLKVSNLDCPLGSAYLFET